MEYALHSSHSEKVPGPDGFSLGCLKIIWQLLKERVMHCLKIFCSSGSFPKGFNSSFIALIPKTNQPKLVLEFRPIILINSVPKLFMKIIAERLSAYMNKLVGENQYRIMRGRQASESILIVNEVCHSLSKDKATGIIFKIDFEKAFDSVNWSFLFDTLKAYGIVGKLINWIRNYFFDMKMSVLVNGSPTTEFVPSRGLRQGDPLSPLLFNLVVEVLSKMIKKTIANKIFKGIKL